VTAQRVEDAIEATLEPATLLRFDRTQRYVHWANALLFGTLMLTGAVLYNFAGVASLVGRRNLVEHIHVYAGLALPLPLLAGLVLKSGARLRADLRTIARWIPDDRMWWHRRTRGRAQLGKFNPGQKLNATFVGATIVVMLATGSIMYWFEFFSNDVRTGATFVHDWFAFFVWITVLGHIAFALREREAFDAMRHGDVPTLWARRQYPRWYVEATATEPVENASGRSEPIR
jgi:formate dehydrogenase subunit gamma